MNKGLFAVFAGNSLLAARLELVAHRGKILNMGNSEQSTKPHSNQRPAKPGLLRLFSTSWRALVWISFLPVLLFSYTNCSQSSDGSLSSNSICPEGNCAMVNGQLVSMKVQNSDLTMQCYENHIQLGGICNPGESAANLISYTLSKDGSPVAWGLGNNAATEAKESRCENGRFTLMIRRPSGTPNCTRCTVEYDLTLKMQIQPSSTEPLQTGTQYSERLSVVYGGCMKPASPPLAGPADLKNVTTPTLNPSSYCYGRGTTLGEVRSSYNGVNNCSSASISWTYNSDGKSVSSLNMTSACPAGTTRYGGCFETTTCKSSGSECSGTNPVLMSCEVYCF